MLPEAAAGVRVGVHVGVLRMNGDVRLLRPVSRSLRVLTSITHISFPSSAAALTLPPTRTRTHTQKPCTITVQHPIKATWADTSTGSCRRSTTNDFWQIVLPVRCHGSRDVSSTLQRCNVRGKKTCQSHVTPGEERAPQFPSASSRGRQTRGLCPGPHKCASFSKLHSTQRAIFFGGGWGTVENHHTSSL